VAFAALLPYSIFYSIDAVEAFPSSPVSLSFSAASTRGFFVSGSATHPSSSLIPSVVVFFAFYA
jgi:hypothetical protein